MKDFSMFSQWSMTVGQAERIYENYSIAFICEGDKSEYHIETEKEA